MDTLGLPVLRRRAQRKAYLVRVDCERGGLVLLAFDIQTFCLHCSRSRCRLFHTASTNSFRIPMSAKSSSLLMAPHHLLLSEEAKENKEGSACGQQGEQVPNVIPFSCSPLVPNPILMHFRRQRYPESPLQSCNALISVHRSPWGSLCSEGKECSLFLVFLQRTLPCAFSKFRKQSTAQGKGECEALPTWC